MTQRPTNLQTTWHSPTIPETNASRRTFPKGFTLWNLVVQLSQSYETVLKCHIDILNAVLKGDGNEEAIAELVAKQLELAERSQAMIADVQEILEEHRHEIASLPVKQ